MIETRNTSGLAWRTIVCGLLICALAGAGCALAGSAQIAASGEVIQVVTIAKQDAPSIFRRVHAVLQRETQVPLRWPGFIPVETSEEHPLYVNLLTEGSDNYAMELGWTSDCIGGGYCHYGSVRASAAPPADSSRPRVPVKLRDGITGYFMESSTCGARCEDAAVGWSEGRYHYLISVKAEKEETMVRVADSAIASGHADEKKDDAGATGR